MSEKLKAKLLPTGKVPKIEHYSHVTQFLHEATGLLLVPEKSETLST